MLNIEITNQDNIVETILSLKQNLNFLKKISPRAVSLYEASNEDSNEIKNFIKERYDGEYKSDIKISYPHLMALDNSYGKIISAAGFKGAQEGELFLEQYLKDNIENILSKKYGKKIKRNEIVELGSLASVGGGTALIFITITNYLQTLGYKYYVFTGTEYLQQHLKSLGLENHFINNADAKKLKQKDSNWGSYYETNPKVMVGNLSASYRTLSQYFGVTNIAALNKFYPQQDYLVH